MSLLPGWSTIKQHLGEALDLEGDARAAFLDQLRQRDPELCREVETLLEGDDAAGDFIETPAVSLRQREEHTDSVGRWIGPWVIVGKLGQGGMGAVYLAERGDRAYEKRAGIKLLKRGMDTAEIVRRFEHERRILAQLDHPGIAQLLDAGSTDDGLPYFVMEHVEGEPIDSYCESHRLGIAQRLELFGAVCEVVSFAHRHLVVHRDLKPANILITAEGKPKLLDFGIAKLLGPDGVAQAELTVLGARAMTPEYASPEQVLGAPIGTASDVYTLGVLLYRLLTGHRPYRFTTRSATELARVICHQEPERPSTVVRREAEMPRPDLDLSRLRRRLRGDLDAIVLKALRKEPHQRYTSVDALVDDIRRHLEQRPVLARRGTFTYRAERFAKRNWLPMSVAAAFLALAVGAGWRELENRQQLAITEARASQAQRLGDLLNAVLENADLDRTATEALTARRFLDAADVEIHEALADQPESLATLADIIGRAYRKLGERTKARKLLEEALEIRRERLGPEDGLFASSLQNLGLLEQDEGRLEQAEELMRQALDIREHLHAGQDHEELAIALNNLAGVLLDREKFDDAEKLGRRAVEMNRRLFTGDPVKLTRGLNTLGRVLQHRNELGAAEEVFRNVLEIRRGAPEAQPNALATALLNLGLNLYGQGRAVEAEPLLREARQIRLELVGLRHADTALADQSLGLALLAQKRYPEAEELLLESLETLEKLPDKSPKRLARAKSDLVALYERWGKPERAAAYAANPTP